MVLALLFLLINTKCQGTARPTCSIIVELVETSDPTSVSKLTNGLGLACQVHDFYRLKIDTNQKMSTENKKNFEIYCPKYHSRLKIA